MADNIARSLSDAAARNAKPQAKPYKLADGGGLFLLILAGVLVTLGGLWMWRLIKVEV